ncbi:hypothetical protein HDU76_006279 [Blyttiomyces sp. JEL0837]|nr:hypothetical protein HDU76_006279 [Blyttiomyces sp. JEL0837]
MPRAPKGKVAAVHVRADGVGASTSITRSGRTPKAIKRFEDEVFGSNRIRKPRMRKTIDTEGTVVSRTQNVQPLATIPPPDNIFASAATAPVNAQDAGNTNTGNTIVPAERGVDGSLPARLPPPSSSPDTPIPVNRHGRALRRPKKLDDFIVGSRATRSRFARPPVLPSPHPSPPVFPVTPDSSRASSSVDLDVDEMVIDAE